MHREGKRAGARGASSTTTTATTCGSPQNHRELTWQLLNRSGGELSDDFLDARSRPLRGTQVDSLWYSTCFSGLTFSHQTRVGDFYGSEVPQELVDLYGRDNLQIQTDFCHANGLEAFWSLRMNDTHDAYPEGIRTAFRELAPFKRDHQHCIMGQPGGTGRSTRRVRNTSGRRSTSAFRKLGTTYTR